MNPAWACLSRLVALFNSMNKELSSLRKGFWLKCTFWFSCWCAITRTVTDSTCEIILIFDMLFSCSRTIYPVSFVYASIDCGRDGWYSSMHVSVESLKKKHSLSVLDDTWDNILCANCLYSVFVVVLILHTRIHSANSSLSEKESFLGFKCLYSWFDLFSKSCINSTALNWLLVNTQEDCWRHLTLVTLISSMHWQLKHAPQST